MLLMAGAYACAAFDTGSMQNPKQRVDRVWLFYCFMLSTLVTSLVTECMYPSTRLRVLPKYQRGSPLEQVLDGAREPLCGDRRPSQPGTRGPCKLNIFSLTNGMLEQFFVLHNKHVASQRDALEVSSSKD